MYTIIHIQIKIREQIHTISDIGMIRCPSLKDVMVVHVQMEIKWNKIVTYIRCKKCKLMVPHNGINEHCLISTGMPIETHIYACEQ